MLRYVGGERKRERALCMPGERTLPTPYRTSVWRLHTVYNAVEQLSKIDIALTARRICTVNAANGRERANIHGDQSKGDSRENQHGEILSLAECFPGLCLVVIVVVVVAVHVLPLLISIFPRLYFPREPLALRSVSSRTFSFSLVADFATLTRSPGERTSISASWRGDFSCVYLCFL